MLASIRFARFALSGCFLLGLLAFAAGCSGRSRSAEHVEVTGQVTFNGQPLPGGRVTFIRSDGFNFVGDIDENGNYKINAPVGEVKISVDNTMLREAKSEAVAKARQKGAGRPDAKYEKQVGHYVEIPEKYRDATKSGLTYTVTKAKGQTHPIELTDK